MPKRAKPSQLTADMLREEMRYDPEDGKLWWIKRGPKRRLDRPAGTIAVRGRHGEDPMVVIGIKVAPGVYEKHYGHRLAWLWMTGAWPDPEVDHANQNTLDNRWSNLREANRSQQGANRIVRPDKLKGAYRASTKSPMWFSHIIKDGKKAYLGLFATEQEAHDAFVKASKEIHGKFHRASSERLTADKSVDDGSGRRFRGDKIQRRQS
jgi:hypothetical protein